MSCRSYAKTHSFIPPLPHDPNETCWSAQAMLPCCCVLLEWHLVCIRRTSRSLFAHQMSLLSRATAGEPVVIWWVTYAYIHSCPNWTIDCMECSMTWRKKSMIYLYVSPQCCSCQYTAILLTYWITDNMIDGRTTYLQSHLKWYTRNIQGF